jgi:hypothetical protein
VRTDILAIAESIDGHVLEAILNKTDVINSLNEETRMIVSTEAAATPAEGIKLEELTGADVRRKLGTLDLTLANFIVSRAQEFKVDVGIYLSTLFPVLFEQGGPAKEVVEKTIDEVVEENRVKVKRKSKRASAEEVQEAKNPPPPPNGTISVDKVRNTLASVIRVTHPDAAKELLGKFDAKRVSDLKEEHFAAFLAECQTQLDAFEARNAKDESPDQSLLG